MYRIASNIFYVTVTPLMYVTVPVCLYDSYKQMKVIMKKSTAPTGRASDKFMLRLPDGMRDTISELAKASGRSEIVHRLQQSIDASLTGELNGGPGSPRMIASVEITDPGIDKNDPRYRADPITDYLKEMREMLAVITEEMKSKK